MMPYLTKVYLQPARVQWGGFIWSRVCQRQVWVQFGGGLELDCRPPTARYK